METFYANGISEISDISGRLRAEAHVLHFVQSKE